MLVSRNINFSLGYYFCVGDVSGIFVIKHLAGENGYR